MICLPAFPRMSISNCLLDTGLMLVFFRVPDENDSDVRHIVVVLFRYSTQKMHDECTNPVIHICSAPRSLGVPLISVEIVGANLAVILVFNHVVTTRHDLLHIFDWKSGKTKSVSMCNFLCLTAVHNVLLGSSTREQYWSYVLERRSLAKSKYRPKVPRRLLHSLLFNFPSPSCPFLPSPSHHTRLSYHKDFLSLRSKPHS
jgi:hypothetical protein